MGMNVKKAVQLAKHKFAIHGFFIIIGYIFLVYFIFDIRRPWFMSFMSWTIAQVVILGSIYFLISILVFSKHKDTLTLMQVFRLGILPYVIAIVLLVAILAVVWLFLIFQPGMF